MTESTELTFEAGYGRLQAISQRVTSEDVPVAEMCDLFAEGKGLQTALTGYLDEQKARVEAIERGEDIRAFRIVAPSADSDDGDLSPGLDFVPAPPADTSDFSPQPVRPHSPAAAPDDDIPF